MFLLKGRFAQYYTVTCANIMTLLYGTAVGWASSSLVLLQSDESPLSSGKLTLFQASWIGSILCVGGAFGQVMFSYFADKFGRKPGLMLAVIPTVISWLLIAFGQEFNSIFISRILCGFVGGATYQIVPLFVSEVSDVEIRGILGSFLMLFTNIGVLVGYIFSNFLPYRVVPWVAIALTFGFLLAFWIVPETPKYLVMKNMENQLEKSVKFYNNSDVCNKNGITCEKQEAISLKLISDSSTINAFKLSFLLMNCATFSGVFTMLNYTNTIFAEAGSNLSPAVSSIIMALIQIAGSYLATIIVERAGRRILILCSAYGSAFCMGVLGAHALMKDLGIDVTSFSWIPLVFLSLLVFIAANGATTVSFIVLGEIFKQNIRGFAIMCSLFYQWNTLFFCVLIFPFLREWLGMYGALWMFTIIESILATFILFMLPETKGRTIDDIVEKLGKQG